jgi:outer membrane protein OmpA-like peptidoglycan-associated protein
LQVAAHLRAHSEIRRLQIVSYVVRRGAPAADKRLSGRRGEAVRKFLVGKGVDPRRLKVVPMGAGPADRIELLVADRR